MGAYMQQRYQLVSYKDLLFIVCQKLFIIFNFQGKNFLNHNDSTFKPIIKAKT